ncbi:hypothetical protein HYW39_02010, partial [Candidatus Curtissbacteria bacterium]|nr:hypothetical protein [Candidatus Curtissbacteria bacterium]
EKLRVTGSGLIEGVLTVLDSLTIQGLIVNGSSTFFGEVVFKDHVAFGQDSIGEAVVKKGKAEVSVVFDKEYDYIPKVNISLVIDDGALEDKILNEGYTYAVVKRSTEGFVIKLNKNASSDFRFSWSAFEGGN